MHHSLQRQRNSSKQRNNKTNRRTALQLTTRAIPMNPQNLRLPREGHVLGYRLVETLPIHNIQPRQIIRLTEEHITPVVQSLKPLGVVREPHVGVGGRRVAEEDALNLVGVVVGELGVSLHDIAVRSIGDEDEFARGESLENFGEEEFADGEGGGNV